MALLLLASCALSSPRAPIRPHLAASLPADVPPERRSLGIGAVRDVRPQSSREARRPRLDLHYWGLSRRGGRRFGDEVLASSPLEAARQDAAATLVRSGAFSQVLWVDADEGAAVERAARGDVDWVLVLDVEDLVAVAQEDWSLNVARVGWIRRRDSPPEGLARLRYRVFDARGSVLDLRVEGRHRGDPRAPARAALDALAVANERAATHLFRAAVPEAQGELRAIVVRVLDGCGLGSAEVGALFARASESFEREAGLRLDVARETWTAPDHARTARALLEHLREIEPPEGGVLFALAPLQPELVRSRRGLAVPLGGHAVSACGTGESVRPTTVAHEIAHLFGAVHVRDRGSVMNPRSDFEARFFDPLNRRILRAMSGRDLGGPLSPERARELRSIYEEAQSLSAAVDPLDLEAALSALAAAAR